MIGDDLLKTITSSSDESTIREAAKALIRECYHGYPPEKLRPLLRDTRWIVLKYGMWIASELGARGRPLLEDMVEFLEHEAPYVRFHAIDSILASSTEEDGDAVARALRRLTDSESSVRWKATQFLMRASLLKLRAAVPYLSGDDFAGLRLLTEGSVSDEDLVSALQGDSPTVRRFALAAAYRANHAGRGNALKAAASSEDPEIREIAERELQ